MTYPIPAPRGWTYRKTPIGQEWWDKNGCDYAVWETHPLDIVPGRPKGCHVSPYNYNTATPDWGNIISTHDTLDDACHRVENIEEASAPLYEKSLRIVRVGNSYALGFLSPSEAEFLKGRGDRFTVKVFWEYRKVKKEVGE